jgi:hypothetical protein
MNTAGVLALLAGFCFGLAGLTVVVRLLWRKIRARSERQYAERPARNRKRSNPPAGSIAADEGTQDRTARARARLVQLLDDDDDTR